MAPNKDVQTKAPSNNVIYVDFTSRRPGDLRALEVRAYSKAARRIRAALGSEPLGPREGVARIVALLNTVDAGERE